MRDRRPVSDAAREPVPVAFDDLYKVLRGVPQVLMQNYHERIIYCYYYSLYQEKREFECFGELKLQLKVFPLRSDRAEMRAIVVESKLPYRYNFT